MCRWTNRNYTDPFCISPIWVVSLNTSLFNSFALRPQWILQFHFNVHSHICNSVWIWSSSWGAVLCFLASFLHLMVVGHFRIKALSHIRKCISGEPLPPMHFQKIISLNCVWPCLNASGRNVLEKSEFLRFDFASICGERKVNKAVELDWMIDWEYLILPGALRC